MNSPSKIYVNQRIRIELDCGSPLDGFGVPAMSVTKPDGTKAVWQAGRSGDTLIVYDTNPNDLDQAGWYRIQALPDTNPGTPPGETALFPVHLLGT